MKTVSGKVTSTTPISLSNAAKSLTKFASSDHGASHAVSVYLHRAANSFNQLVKVHEKLNPNSLKKEHCTNDIKVEEICEVGLKVEDIVKNEDIPIGSLEIMKSKNLEKDENPKAGTRNKNEDIPNGSRENKKNKNLGKEENPKADNKIRNSESGKSNKNELKNEDVPSGSLENKKSKNLGKEKNPKADMSNKIKTEQLLDTGEGETEKSKKNELEFVEADSAVKMEPWFEEVKEDGAGDSEREMVKVVEELENKEEGRKKRKSMDTDAGDNTGSAEQNSKKKSKRRRIEGEK
ncbi:hypothetical protein RND71_009871 [Anisodus tanguticus]|uniref:Uncharacterized protein n=1 Tax=Anisodus tanguticus TaxID=243964 RepID=A0AAE1SIN2_9SOLA|nr:hypothetical protein RND71_009871 [Anisodus tanguticus]